MGLKEIAENPKLLYISAANRGLTNFVSDERHIKIVWSIYKDGKLNLDNPETFCEKLQWLKLHDRNPAYPKMVDKVEMKDWVSSRIGPGHVVPIYGVWDSFDQIDREALPNEFVIKTTHDSSGLSICKDKKTFDWAKAKARVEKSLSHNYFMQWREWPYKDVRPRVFAEKLITESGGRAVDGDALTDYKFFCFNGEPKVMYVSKDTSRDPRTDFFDMGYIHLPIRMADPNADDLPPKPAAFDEMKHYAAMLSRGIPHLRVDFYYIEGRVYVGELTFYHNAGFSRIEPPEWDKKLGDWIDLSLAYGPISQ